MKYEEQCFFKCGLSTVFLCFFIVVHFTCGDSLKFTIILNNRTKLRVLTESIGCASLYCISYIVSSVHLDKCSSILFFSFLLQSSLFA